MKNRTANHFPPADQYSLFAECYDDIMTHVDYKTWAKAVTSMLRLHKCPGKNILDAACGTGTMLLLLHKKGFKVNGMDLSQAMLNQTKKKMKKAQLPGKCFQGDIRNFQTSQQYDAILCLHDSINYMLSPQEIEQALRSFYNALNPNGILIFDASTHLNILKNFSGHTFCDNKRDFSFLWRNKFNILSGRMKAIIEFIVKDGKHAGKEVHPQRIYRRRKIRKIINKSKLFSIASEYDGFSLNKPNFFAEEITFVCKKVP